MSYIFLIINYMMFSAEEKKDKKKFRFLRKKRFLYGYIYVIINQINSFLLFS